VQVTINSKNKFKIIILIIVILAVLIFIFPKKSIEWGSAIGRQKSCRCFGIELDIFSNIEGYTLVYCCGIPYECISETNNISYSDSVKSFLGEKNHEMVIFDCCCTPPS
jgi:hypothetical protein